VNHTLVWRRRRFPCARGRAVVVAEEADVDGGGGGGDRRSREQRSKERGGDLESFGMKSEMTWGGLLFISLKLSATILT
jgi:hypothetical protein